MRLLVLAGGFGTRLSSVLGSNAKALAPIGEKPFLRIQLEHWISQGITQFSFLLHHQADQIISFLDSEKTGVLKSCDIDYVIEATPLDTGGAVANAAKELRLQGDFLLVNADTWLSTGIKEVSERKSPSIAVVRATMGKRYGQVRFNQKFQVTSFTEKGENVTVGWINAGLFKLTASVFSDWDGTSFSLERKVLTELADTRTLRAIPLETNFIDIGIPSDYTRFCRWISNNRKLPL
jgi:D-glycero-alpha-D-manno-heptose 1-phosphate guanylyltransferase